MLRPRSGITAYTLALLVIVLIGVLTRLYRIDEPLRGFRPNDTAAIARNFYETGGSILYPQVDWRGSSPGYVEAEFQIYPFAIALLYRVFGVHEWFGAGLNAGFYALACLLLFRLTRGLYEERTAVLAVLFYAFAPLGFFYSRSFQPDTLLAFASLAGVYYFWQWAENRHWNSLALSAAGISLAALLKPASLYLGLPLLYLCYRALGWRFLRKPELWVFAGVAIVPAILWYRHAFHLWQEYGNTFGVIGGWVKYRFFPPTFSLWPSVAKQTFIRVWLLIATPVGFLFLLAGFFSRPPRGNYLLHWWAVGFGISALLVAKGYQIHDYYVLPIIFLIAVWMARGAVGLAVWNRLAAPYQRAALVVAILSIVGFSVWRWTIRMQYPQEEWDRVAFARRIERLTEPDALIVMMRPYRGTSDLYQHRTAQGEYLECDPVDFYHSHRKGWSVDDQQATAEYVEVLHHRGAKYFATAFAPTLNRHQELRSALEERYTAVEVTPKWAIYRLDKARPGAEAGQKPGRTSP